MPALAGSLVLLVFVAGYLFSQDISFTATVDRNTLSVGEPLTLTLTAASGVTSSLPEPVLGTMSGDFEVGGTSSQSSSSISFVNGDLRSEKTVAYISQLIPTRAGELTIPPAILTYKGRKYRTEPITVTVSEGGEKKKPRRIHRGLARKAPPAEATTAEDEVFIHVAANKDRVYCEEGVVLEYSLYSTLTIQDVRMIELPESGGFWWEEDAGFSNERGGKEVVNGRIYAVYPLKRYIVYPLEPGTRLIEPMGLTCRVRVRAGDIFDAFSIFGREENVRAVSEPLTLTVLPIPEEGRPSGYQGAVGRFTVKASLDKNEVATNEAVTLRVTVEGEGNFRIMGSPALQFPDAISSYPPDEKVEAIFGGDALHGKKTFEYVLIPRDPGDFEIGSIVYPYFDPERGSFTTADSGPLELSVLQGSLAMPGSAGGSTQTLLLGEDIRYIKDTPSGFAAGGSSGRAAWTFVASNMLSALLFVGFLVQKKRAEKILGDRALMRYRGSGKALRKTLREAEGHLGEENHGLFAQRCEKAIIDFIGDRLDRETTGMTEKELTVLLEQGKAGQDTLELFSGWHRLCHEARFSPRSGGREEAGALLKATRQLAETLEAKLP